MTIQNEKSRFIADHTAHRRKKDGCVYAEGERVVDEALFRGDWPVSHLVIDHEAAIERIDVYTERARDLGVEIVYTNSRAMARISTCDSPPPIGVMLTRSSREVYTVAGLPRRCVVLAGVRDPGNAGTIIRSASAFGFAVILAGDGVRLSSEKLIRSSAGICLHPGVVFEGGAMDRLVDFLSDEKVELMSLTPIGGISLDNVAITESYALILGGETAGIDSATRARSIAVRVPMNDNVESLNVAVAGSIAMYTLSRRACG